MSFEPLEQVFTVRYDGRGMKTAHREQDAYFRSAKRGERELSGILDRRISDLRREQQELVSKGRHTQRLVDVNKELAKWESRRSRLMSAGLEETSEGHKEVADSADNMGSRLKTVWAGFVAYLGAQVVGGLARAQRKLFEMATAVEETASKFTITFGDSADRVDQFVDTYGRLAGMSNQQGREMTATLGAVAQGFGASKDAAADFAIEVVRVAGDMASFNNMGTPEMLQAIRSGLAGEVEPLRRYGIELSAANVEQKAFQMTGKDTVDSLTSQEKVYARLALIQEQAGIQMGDLERTQGSASNQWKKFTGNIRQQADEWATKWLPTFTRVLTSANAFFKTSTDMAAAIKTSTDEIRRLGEAEAAVRVVAELQDKTHLTVEEHDKLRESLKLLQEQFPGYVKNVNDAGEAISVYTDNLALAIQNQKDLAAGRVARDFSEMVDEFGDAQRDVERLRAFQATIGTRIDEEKERIAQLAEDGSPLAAQQLLLSEASLASLVQEFSQTGVKLRSAEADVRQFKRNVFELAEVLGDERIEEAFVASGMSAARAKEFVAELREEMTALAKASEESDDGGDGGSPSVVDTLSARLKALKEERDMLIDAGMATERLAQINNEILDIEKQARELSQYGIEDLKEKEKLLKAQAEEAEKQRKAEKAAREAIRDIPLSSTVQSITALSESFEAEANKIRIQFERGLIDKETLTAGLKDVGERYRTALLEILTLIEQGASDMPAFSLWNQMPLGALGMSELKLTEEQLEKIRALVLSLVDDADNWGCKTKDVTERHKEIAKSLHAIATSGRALLRVQDILGDMGDETRKAAEGLLDVIDNLGTLQGLGSDASFFEKLIPKIGIASGALSIVATMFSGDDAEDLEEAIKENTRRIERAVLDLAQAPRPSESITGEQFEFINREFRQILTATNPIRDQGYGTEAQIETARSEAFGLIDSLRDMGIDGITDEVLDAMRQQFEQALRMDNSRQLFDDDGFLLGYELSPDSIVAALEQFWGLLEPIAGSDQGGFNTGSVDGILALVSMLQGVGGLDTQQTFGRLVELLNGLDVDSSDLKSFFSSLTALDPTSAEGQEAIRNIVAEMARRAGGEGESVIDFGKLTPKQLDSILQSIVGVLDGAPGAGVEAGEGALITNQVQQTYTTFQANEHTVLFEEANFLSRERNELLAEIRDLNQSLLMQMSPGALPGAASLAMAGASQVNIHVDASGNLTMTEAAYREWFGRLVQDLDMEIQKNVLIRP